ncbi:MAG: RIP metalloprotease RseP [Deltaproteobacteria bacterium]|nr:RIP metalloprotease RseP [Deltaproteobacteria bacterium]
MTIGSTLAAILVLAIVIFIHELGHFLVGKWCDVEIKVFSMGFGPTVIARQFGETVYRLALIPLGGYVRMAGYDEEGGDGEEAPSDPARGFTAKPIAQRVAVVAAGPLVNLVFAAVLFSACAFAYGVSTPSNEPVVGGVVAGEAAEASGLRDGDRILSIDGTPVRDWEELLKVVLGSGGRTLNFELQSPDGERRTAQVTPKVQSRTDAFGEEIDRVYRIGVHQDRVLQPVGALEAVSIGASQTVGYSTMILQTVGRLIQGRLSAGDLGGPILIAREASAQARKGLQPLLVFMALISVNLGIVNLLPIPVLDGGHLMFMTYEAVRGRPLSLRVREYALQAGMLLIGGLMIFVVFHDIIRIVAG